MRSIWTVKRSSETFFLDDAFREICFIFLNEKIVQYVFLESNRFVTEG